jgi:HSP20 family protein
MDRQQKGEDIMIRRRRYPFALLWNELDEMMAEWESRVQNTITTGASLPSMVRPALKREFRVDVREEMDEVIVVADLPGVDKKDLTIRLINPLNLELSVVNVSEPRGESEGSEYYIRERLSGNMRRVVSLPAEVIDEEASATFRNGVLEIRLRKALPESGSLIPID